MKKVLIFLSLIWSSALGFEGPDFMLMSRYYLPAAETTESLISDDSKSPVGFYFADANLYDIKSLNWVYGSLDFNTHWGKFGLSFRDYGIKDMYSSTRLEISFSRPMWRSLSAGIAYAHDRHTYGQDMFKAANDYISVNAGYSLATLDLATYLGDFPIHRGIKGAAKHPELVTAINWRAEEIISLYGIFLKDAENHTRFDLGQKLNLAKPLTIDAGFLTGPQVYYVGTTVTYKRFAFEYIFYDVNELPGCWSVTLGYR